MSQQTISLGTAANDGTGDPIRTAGGKINANFTEVYARRGAAWIYTAGTIGVGLFKTDNAAIASTGTITLSTALALSNSPFGNTQQGILVFSNGAGSVYFSISGASNDGSGNAVFAVSNTSNWVGNWAGEYEVSFFQTALTSASVGLDNVDNTSDANKPVSTAQQAAIDALTAAQLVITNALDARITALENA